MITHVKKSRKDYKCSKCTEIIPKGSSYIRGELNFAPAIIRCVKCGLKSYEVTTSDYIRSVGAIVEDWRNDYSADESGRDCIVEDLANIMDELQDRFDNMPEGLQLGDTGQLLEERIDSLQSAIDSLEYIDFDDCSENTETFAELIDDALTCIEY